MGVPILKGYGLEKMTWIALRLALGWTLFWAFLDKLMGLGYATTSASAWVNGGSPTSGYLGYATSGPLAGMYEGLAGNVAIDWLFMVALLFIGGALILGIGMKIAGYSGAALMVLLWSTRLPPENNPIIDEHIVFLAVFLGLTVVKAGHWLGFGKWWIGTDLVKRYPFLE